MKENFCKGCTFLVKVIENGSVVAHRCSVGKKILTTIQDSVIPGLKNIKLFSRPEDSSCKHYQKREV